MARKKKHEEHENHERWLISYADFITLLFAFFVVMYSVSSVNEGKYRVLSQSMIKAFGEPMRSFQPIQEGQLIRARQSRLDRQLNEASALIRPIDRVQDGEGDRKGGPSDEMKAKMANMASELESELAALIDDGMIRLRRTDNWLEVEIRSNVLFGSGSSVLAVSAVPVLQKISKALQKSNNIVRVEGFTDNVPINTVIFPSNWELSAARAATVVRLFADQGLDPRRMISVGYGEYRPIGDNATPEGRSANRRVVIVVLARELDDELKETRPIDDYLHDEMMGPPEMGSPEVVPEVVDATPDPVVASGPPSE
ncbi:MAG: flagellar motor protein MotD [Pseudomonadales bacterium]|nr:flagellar motor protein MotD [Pseudomonadales bacterium]